MPEVVDIDEEIKRHKDEWLLFEVTEIGENDRSVEGRLLWHSKSRDEIHEVIMKDKRPGVTLQTIFTGDPVPAGMVVVL